MPSKHPIHGYDLCKVHSWCHLPPMSNAKDGGCYWHSHDAGIAALRKDHQADRDWARNVRQWRNQFPDESP